MLAESPVTAADVILALAVVVAVAPNVSPSVPYLTRKYSAAAFDDPADVSVQEMERLDDVTLVSERSVETDETSFSVVVLDCSDNPVPPLFVARTRK